MKYDVTVKPYPISAHESHYARHVWFSSYGVPRGVTLRTTVHLDPSLTLEQQNSWKLLAAICRAASTALVQHPRLNFYTFWGKLVCGGCPPRLTVIIENGDYSCDMVVVQAANEKNVETIIQELKNRNESTQPAQSTSGLKAKLPFFHFLIERLTGAYEKNYCRLYAPLWISMIGLSEIEEVTYTPAHSMALYPSSRKNGDLVLTLCFNHQLANARPVGRFLTTLKSLLE